MRWWGLCTHWRQSGPLSSDPSPRACLVLANLFLGFQGQGVSKTSSSKGVCSPSMMGFQNLPPSTPPPSQDGSCPWQRSQEGTAATYGRGGDLSGGRLVALPWPVAAVGSSSAVPTPTAASQMHFTQTCMAVAMATAAWRWDAGDRGERGGGGCAVTRLCIAASAPHGLASPQLRVQPVPSSRAGAHPSPQRADTGTLLPTCVSQAVPWPPAPTHTRSPGCWCHSGRMRTEPLTPLSGLGGHKASGCLHWCGRAGCALSPR